MKENNRREKVIRKPRSSEKKVVYRRNCITNRFSNHSLEVEFTAHYYNVRLDEMYKFGICCLLRHIFLNYSRIKMTLILGALIWILWLPIDLLANHKIVGNEIYYVGIGLRVLPIPFAVFVLLMLLVVPIRCCMCCGKIDPKNKKANRCSCLRIGPFCFFEYLGFMVLAIFLFSLTAKAASFNKNSEGYPVGTMLFCMAAYLLTRPRMHIAVFLAILTQLSYCLAHFSFNYDVLFFSEDTWSTSMKSHVYPPIGTCNITIEDPQCFSQEIKRIEIPLYMVGIGVTQILGLVLVRMLETYSRKVFIYQRELKSKTEEMKIEGKTQQRLLLNILPKEYVHNVKERRLRFVKKYRHISIICSDIVNFTNWSSEIEAEIVLDVLNAHFSAFDRLAYFFGDAYISCGGMNHHVGFRDNSWKQKQSKKKNKKGKIKNGLLKATSSFNSFRRRMSSHSLTIVKEGESDDDEEEEEGEGDYIVKVQNTGNDNVATKDRYSNPTDEALEKEGDDSESSEEEEEEGEGEEERTRKPPTPTGMLRVRSFECNVPPITPDGSSDSEEGEEGEEAYEKKYDEEYTESFMGYEDGLMDDEEEILKYIFYCSIEMGLAMIEAVQMYNSNLKTPLSIRVGISSGETIIGVLGRNRLTFDAWGRNVSKAVSLEAAGVDDKVHVSGFIHDKTQEYYDFEHRGMESGPSTVNLDLSLNEMDETYLIKSLLKDNLSLKLLSLHEESRKRIQFSREFDGMGGNGGGKKNDVNSSFFIGLEIDGGEKEDEEEKEEFLFCAKIQDKDFFNEAFITRIREMDAAQCKKTNNFVFNHLTDNIIRHQRRITKRKKKILKKEIKLRQKMIKEKTKQLTRRKKMKERVLSTLSANSSSSSVQSEETGSSPEMTFEDSEKQEMMLLNSVRTYGRSHKKLNKERKKTTVLKSSLGYSKILLIFYSFQTTLDYYKRTFMEERGNIATMLLLEIFGYAFMIGTTGVISTTAKYLEESGDNYDYDDHQFISIALITQYSLLLIQVFLTISFLALSLCEDFRGLFLKRRALKRMKQSKLHFLQFDALGLLGETDDIVDEEDPNAEEKRRKLKKKRNEREKARQRELDITKSRKNSFPTCFFCCSLFTICNSYLVGICFALVVISNVYLSTNFVSLFGFWTLLSLTMFPLVPFILRAFIAILFCISYILVPWLIYYERFDSQRIILNIFILVSCCFFSVFMSYLTNYNSISNYRLRRKVEDKILQVVQNNIRNKDLLSSVLPSSVIERLSNPLVNENTIADKIHQGSVLFVSIKGFEAECLQESNESYAFETLNTLFNEMDELTERYTRCHKVKSTGSTYIIVAGIGDITAMTNSESTTEEEKIRNAQELAILALEIRDRVMNILDNCWSLKVRWSVRLGLNVGDFCAGILGHVKFLYDIFGDAVNLSSRLCTSGRENCIHICDGKTREFLLSVIEPERIRFKLKKRGVVRLKGKGDMMVYFLDSVIKRNMWSEMKKELFVLPILQQPVEPSEKDGEMEVVNSNNSDFGGIQGMLEVLRSKKENEENEVEEVEGEETCDTETVRSDFIGTEEVVEREDRNNETIEIIEL